MMNQMSGSTTGGTGSPAPKILLAKPALVPAGTVASEDDTTSLRTRLPPSGSLNLISDSWGFHTDRFLPFLTENTDFTVIGVIGPPGVGKSTILNELYGFDGSSPGMLPPFAIQSEDTRAMARHCTIGMEPRVTAERFILLDTQPVFSSSVLAEMMKPDGSSSIPVLGSESLSAELAHELMGIQVAVLLASICHLLLVVSEGVHNSNIWHLMSTGDLLKHGIPDPSLPNLSHSNLGSDKDTKDKVQDGGEEYMATPIFIHTKVCDEDLSPHDIAQLRKTIAKYFTSSSFTTSKNGDSSKEHLNSTVLSDFQIDATPLNLFTVPLKSNDESVGNQYESYDAMLWKLRDQILSMNSPSFARPVSERDWLRNSAKIWELVKNSPIISEYSKTLQSSGLFRRSLHNDMDLMEAVRNIEIEISDGEEKYIFLRDFLW